MLDVHDQRAVVDVVDDAVPFGVCARADPDDLRLTGCGRRVVLIALGLRDGAIRIDRTVHDVFAARRVVIEADVVPVFVDPKDVLLLALGEADDGRALPAHPCATDDVGAGAAAIVDGADDLHARDRIVEHGGQLGLVVDHVEAVAGAAEPACRALAMELDTTGDVPRKMSTTDALRGFPHQSIQSVVAHRIRVAHVIGIVEAGIVRGALGVHRSCGARRRATDEFGGARRLTVDARRSADRADAQTMARDSCSGSQILSIDGRNDLRGRDFVEPRRRCGSSGVRERIDRGFEKLVA